MQLFLRPLQDILNGLERCLVSGVIGLVATFGGLIATWWVYVPVHELLHAFGCELGGGRVWRLEIDPLYGGALLARWLPFVEAGGEYAGRLAGFDTADSTAVHLLTTGLPFLLTVFPGVWLLRWGARRARGFVFGAALAPATAPFLSATGDAYELGSLAATQLAPWSSDAARAALIGDDVTVVVPGLAGGGGVLWSGFVVAAALGVLWAFFTYAAGAAVAEHLGQPALERLPRPPRRGALAIVVVATTAGCLALTACEQGRARALAPAEEPAAAAGQTRGPTASAGELPQDLRVRVLASFPHDATSYTQGLLWEPDGLVESAGRYGESLVRRWRPGAKRPVAQERLGDGFFGEGITLVGETLIQLSWREGVAFYRDRATLREKKRRFYEGEGWGLCYDGEHLIMSDGTDQLTERDPESFLELRRVAVVAGGAPLGELNELECVDGVVYANVYGTDRIARIDPSSGRVTAMIDASGLLTPAEQQAGAELLNGIAYNTETETFYLTGKLWPRLFEVTFEPAAKRPGGTG